jgi:hypothetical protein
VAGAASYVLRDGTQVGTAASPGFTDTFAVGTTLSYTVRTIDDLVVFVRLRRQPR